MLSIWVRLKGFEPMPLARAPRWDAALVADSEPFELRDGTTRVSGHATRDEAERAALLGNSPWRL